DYGKLARLDVKGLKAGARVEIAEGKIHPTDFALWKFSKTKRDMEWDSSFGRGFPGWHIECSAMAMKYLGATIDIHCGGVDHITVHHTNEIAQSEAATGERFSNYWLHNEFMQVDGKKMSKSLGNFYKLSDLTDKGFTPVAFRYFCLSSHYRSQINFTLDSLQDAEKTVKNINDFVHRLKHSNARGNNKTIDKELEKTEKIFTESVNDDLNMPKALAALFDLMRSVNGEIDAGRGAKESLDMVHAFFVKINGILNVLEETKMDLNDDEKKLLELREHFRRQKDFKAADDIRAQLKERGIEIEDTVHGMRWKHI
ncbi:MAG TPA: DALR domain-containing protein, partial [archaeon]|nr:DALR domain-containing protein [archaeon]